MSSAPTLIILGSSITALAVARHARCKGWKAVIADDHSGPAMATRCAKKLFLDSNKNSAAPLATLTEIASQTDSCRLIATSDRWLLFIVQHRDALEACYSAILHPSNPILEICLSKLAFHQFCDQIGILTPHQWTSIELVKSDNKKIWSNGIILRPSLSTSQSQQNILKAQLVTNLADFIKARSQFEAADIPWICTESLLNREIRQISVGIARSLTGSQAVCIEKLRPPANSCSVGTFTKLHHDDDAVNLAINLIEELNFLGIGEVEILHDIEANEYFLIELNARPWTQYSLVTAAGWDFLAVADGASPTHGVKSGLSWISEWEDLYACFNRSNGLIFDKKIKFVKYVKSLFLPIPKPALFKLIDPMPLLITSAEFLGFRKIG